MVASVSDADANLGRIDFPIDGLTRRQPVPNVESDRVGDQLAGLGFGLPLGVAPLKAGANGNVSAILVLLDNDREFNVHDLASCVPDMCRLPGRWHNDIRIATGMMCRQHSGCVYVCVFTTPHHPASRRATVLAAVKRSSRAMNSSGAWQTSTSPAPYMTQGI